MSPRTQHIEAIKTRRNMTCFCGAKKESGYSFLGAGVNLLRTRQGYLALTSAIIIGGFVLAIALTVGMGSFLSRGAISSAYYKETSFALAEGCIDVALLGLAEDDAYAGGETIAVDDGTCNILAVQTDGSQKIISASASFQGSETNIRLRVNEGDLTLISWEEVSAF